MTSQAALYVFANVSDLASNLRSYILQAQTAALERHGTFKVAVSGGSLPNTLAKALITPSTDSSAGQVHWDKWEIFFADERAVPLDDPDSNYKLVNEEILMKLPSGTPQPIVRPIDVAHLDNLQELADQYGELLVQSFAAKDSVRLPVFDLVLLGCGPDGHTCSLFPNHELLREHDAWAAPISDSPKPPSKRITLTLPVVTHGIRVAFVATGEGKREIFKKIFDSEEGQGLPCALVNSLAGDRVSWFTDRPAVQGLNYPQKGSVV